MNKSACSAVICQPGGCEQNHDNFITNQTNQTSLDYIPITSKPNSPGVKENF